PAGIDLLDRTAHYDAIVRNAAIVHRLSTGINDFSGNSLVFHWISVRHISHPFFAERFEPVPFVHMFTMKHDFSLA
ncbi:MAG: hypothetical protein PHI85_11010, partial [Victivallaceae bacterium]|nr:hypothetical protein [Victivallaceae bacterium]